MRRPMLAEAPALPFIAVERVTKTYATTGKTTEVLCDVNLTIARGELVAIVGSSGSGKTTLLSILAGLACPDSGSVTMKGATVTGPGPERGVVFQNYSLLPWLTVTENIRLAVDRVFPSLTRERRAEHVAKYVRMVNLSASADKKPAELSGGMRQRVAVARALAMEPEVLLMDEPFGALDALTRATLQDELARIWHETRCTIVLVTNDVDEAILLADRIFPMTRGPAATLGPSVLVEVARPRDRRAIRHDPAARAARARVLERLHEHVERGSTARPIAASSTEDAAASLKSRPASAQKAEEYAVEPQLDTEAEEACA